MGNKSNSETIFSMKSRNIPILINETSTATGNERKRMRVKLISESANPKNETIHKNEIYFVVSQNTSEKKVLTN